MKIVQRPEAQPLGKPDCDLVLTHPEGRVAVEVVHLCVEAGRPLRSFLRILFFEDCYFYLELTERAWLCGQMVPACLHLPGGEMADTLNSIRFVSTQILLLTGHSLYWLSELCTPHPPPTTQS